MTSWIGVTWIFRVGQIVNFISIFHNRERESNGNDNSNSNSNSSYSSISLILTWIDNGYWKYIIYNSVRLSYRVYVIH